MVHDEKELLKEIFENVNYWIAFGEAKNAGLLAFDIAVLAIIFSGEEINIWGYILAIFIMISILCVFLAMWSRFDVIWENKGVPNLEDNLLYYRDIAKYSEQEYIISIYKKYLNRNIENVDDVGLYIKHLASEICINAKIACKKYNAFNMAVALDGIAIIVMLVLTIIA